MATTNYDSSYNNNSGGTSRHHFIIRSWLFSMFSLKHSKVLLQSRFLIVKERGEEEKVLGWINDNYGWKKLVRGSKVDNV